MGKNLHLKNLITPLPKDALYQIFVDIGLGVLVKKIFFNSVNVFSLFCYYLLLERCGVLHLNKLQNLSQKDSLCPVWLKLTQWFWRRRYFNFVNVFSLLRYNLPLEKSGVFHFNKLEFPLPKDVLCQIWLKLVQ